MIDRISADTETHFLLGEGGLKPVKYRLTYASDAFQELLHEAFGNLFPLLHSDDEGRYWYESFDEESRETTSISRSLKAGEAWPSHEITRLFEGWLRFKELAANLEDKRLQAMAFGLQLPDPEIDIRCYRQYRDSNGIIRMHVLYGFQKRTARHAYLAEDLFKFLKVRPVTKPMELPPVAVTAKRRQSFNNSEKNNFFEPIVAPPLALACIASLAAVFLTIFFTQFPELMRRQQELSNSEFNLPLQIKKPIPDKSSFSDRDVSPSV